MSYAVAMLRLPKVAAVFAAGDIDMEVFAAIVYRTELVTDEAAMAAVDGELAARVGRWPSMTRGRLATEIDRVVRRHDRDAVRRARERALDRRVSCRDKGNGTAELSGLLASTDAAALEKRLDALAATVCRMIRAPSSSAAPTGWGPRGGVGAVGVSLRGRAVPGRGSPDQHRGGDPCGGRAGHRGGPLQARGI